MKTDEFVDCLFMYEERKSEINRAIRRNVVVHDEDYIIVRLKNGEHINRVALLVPSITKEEAFDISNDLGMKQTIYGKYLLFTW